MYRCLNVYMCGVNVYVYMCICVNVYLCICVYVYMCTYAYMDIGAYIFVSCIYGLYTYWMKRGLSGMLWKCLSKSWRPSELGLITLDGSPCNRPRGRGK